MYRNYMRCQGYPTFPPFMSPGTQHLAHHEHLACGVTLKRAIMVMFLLFHNKVFYEPVDWAVMLIRLMHSKEEKSRVNIDYFNGIQNGCKKYDIH